MSALRLRNIGKTYGGRRALVDVNAELASGQVTAIVGPNGAGKSTLLGILSTLVTPTTGELRWDAEVLARGSMARAAIGYVGHEPGMYGDLSATQNLVLFAELYGLDRPGARATAMLARVGLGEVPPDAAVRTFSRGMQQRMALARALLHEPSLLLFDEPGSALDPAGAAWLTSELATERAAGRIVVLVTHDLDAAGAITDHLLVLRRGRVAYDETRASGFDAAAVRAIYEERTRG
jgi:ABC-type multidrug transport system ATPase subunit